MLARLRQDSADERRHLDMASSDARAELLLSRLRLGAGLMRWSEGVGLGDSTRARVTSDLSEAAALLHLPPSVKPELLLGLMPAEGDGDLASVADAYLKDAEALDLDIRGSADHPHAVQLTASQVQQIGARQRVSVLSTNVFAHDHTVTFN